MANRDDNVALLVGMFLAGAAVGATVALLFAPQSGRESREALMRAAERAREGLTRAPGALRDAIGAKWPKGSSDENE